LSNVNPRGSLSAGGAARRLEKAAVLVRIDGDADAAPLRGGNAVAQRIITIEARKCTGCRLCELACSVRNEGVSSPTRSRIQVVKWDEEGCYVPMVCQQCEDAPCAEVCPVQALTRDPETDVIRLDEQRCIRCRLCVQACPFGAMGYDGVRETVFKCELCGGDPECVKFCEPGALAYVEATGANLEKRRAAAGQLAALMRKTH